MLDTKLQAAFSQATVAERSAALDLASKILANLVHYQGRKSHYTDDIQRLAAELLHLCQGMTGGAESILKNLTEC
jgi:hypothetical protein